MEGLLTNPEGIYVDATFGGGGHAEAILAHLSPYGSLYAIDKDPEAPFHRIQDQRCRTIRGDFRDIEALLARQGVTAVHGILADLGISSHQVDTGDRGFSYRKEALLDLRMDPTTGEPAYRWLQRQTPTRLAAILRTYGDLPKSRRLAEVILQRWHTGFTTKALAECAYLVYGRAADRYLSPLFQAIRIAINDELGALDALLNAADNLIMPGGRLVVLTYHSGEARLLKAHLRRPHQIHPITGQQAFLWRLLRKVSPSPAEVQSNPRSRSATLWIAEKL
ncbi:MAG: 16S rRNA (cytosine(1402)-N(4))-methyltransferase RsmH [Bacteroidia bacterium]|nr:16S rRNA (cytosine(1402)-N(4))-methyltransferase RsmH [Bacteroidia bacterium]MDW8416470.1 16S rRNA (cytosine(1402)-N(4))-methyltransferase RsmH [Bacteroidia bacterium]